MKAFPETEQEAREQARRLSLRAEHVVCVYEIDNGYEKNWTISGSQLTAPYRKVTGFYKGQEVND